MQAAFDESARAAADSAATARTATEHFGRIADTLESEMRLTNADATAAIEERVRAAVKAEVARLDIPLNLNELIRFPKAAFEIRSVDGIQHELVNSGGASAYEVDVTAERTSIFIGIEMVLEWKVGESRVVSIAGNKFMGPPQLTVQWRDTPMDPVLREWKRLLPMA